MATIGAFQDVSGCVTQDKFLLGRTIEEIERLVGFHRGRLGQGLIIVKLDRLPEFHEFELAAMSNVATHRHETPSGLDLDKVKRLAMESWSLYGPDRLVKVLANIRHDDSLDPDIQYPPGLGVPQWKLTTPIRGTVVAVIPGQPRSRYVRQP